MNLECSYQLGTGSRERENIGDRYRDIGEKREEHGTRYREREKRNMEIQRGKTLKEKDTQKENEKGVETERQEK